MAVEPLKVRHVAVGLLCVNTVAYDRMHELLHSKVVGQRVEYRVVHVASRWLMCNMDRDTSEYLNDCVM